MTQHYFSDVNTADTGKTSEELTFALKEIAFVLNSDTVLVL